MMKLLTKAQRMKMIKNHQQQDGTKEFDGVVKLFNPIGLGTWYLSELDPDTNIAWGVCSITDAEYGSVSIDEIEETTLAMGLKIERDKFWKPCSLRECLDIEKEKGL